ncbi:MAG: Gfo/Idh/MocA family oxidoreductase [Chloroflexi bacterium]|nr:Gfo/Idh/MocA family oxidoreductase [Chloroflexota bacterium]
MRVYTGSVIGGGMGGRLSMSALSASPRFELKAMADLKADVRGELHALHPEIELFANHNELFRACPTDVVCVSTFPPTHREVVLEALKLPLVGILCEKPLGDTYVAGREILEAVKAAGIPMAVPHGMLKQKHVEEIIARVRGGEIGTLELVEMECHRWDIMNAGIHWLNLFVNLVPDDPAKWVMCAIDDTMRTYRDSMQVETTAVTMVETHAGVRMVMQTGDDVHIMRPGKDFIFRLIGTRGTIEFYAYENCYLLTNAQHPNGSEIVPQPYAEGAHQRHLEGIIEQAESGKLDYSIAESSLRALELVEAAYLAAEHHCQVLLPLETFTPPAPNDWQPGKPYSGSGGGRDGRKL